MFDYVEQENLDMHGLLIVRHGYIVTEAYFYPYRQRDRHNIYSCTKSFTSALVGIAIGQGHIDSLDHKVLDFFPEYTVAHDDAQKQAMTLEHLLTMTSGLDWPEFSEPYSSLRNILMQMLRRGNWVRFVLDRPMAAEPGTTFNYNTGASHLLSAIMKKTTGMNTSSFARKHLFDPLGISTVFWRSDPGGVTFGGGGIWMRPRDMAKLGHLYLESGVWDGQQVVPAEWIEASVAAPHYGYQWWILPDGAYAALGYKGQRIFVMPHLDMVVVFTGALASDTPSLLVDTFIVPAARSSEPLPENPEGMALLESRIDEVAQP